MLNKKLLTTIFALATLLVPQGAWADEPIFSMTGVTSLTSNTEGVVTSPTDGVYNVSRKKTVTINATFVGGTAVLYNGKGKESDTTQDEMLNNGTINLNGSGNSYVKITLSGEENILEGDIINVTTASGSTIRISANGKSDGGRVLTIPYTVDATDAAGIKNKNYAYFGKNGAAITSLTSITITRPQPATPVFSPASGEEVAQGSKITVTSTYATTIKYQWTASTTTPTEGWSTYNSTDKVTVPAATDDTPYLHVQCERSGVTGTTTAYAQYTITGADTDAPTLESTSPEDGDEDIAVAGDIVLTFNENVACTTNATLTPEGGEAIELTPVVSGTTVTYSYEGLAYQKAHTFALAANSVTDVSSNAYTSAIGFSFTTAQEVVADPTFNVVGGYSFTIACATAGATIYYTVDDDDPKNSDSKIEYTTTGSNRLGIKNSGDHTVYAYAVKAGAVTSDVVEQAITVPTSGDTNITTPLTIKLQPTSAGSDDQYDNDTYTNNGFSLSSNASLYNASSVSGFGDASLSFKANSGTLTVTAPSGVTIQAIKVYAMRNSNGNVTTISTTSGHTRKSSSNRIIPRLTYDYDSGIGMMSEHVIMKDEPDNTCQFTIADQSRLYVEVYADVELTTLDSYGNATFASAYPLDLAHMSATTTPTAYKAAVSGTRVDFTPVDEAVAANTGILLQGGADETVTIPVVASGTDISSSNDFKVNTSGTTMGSADTENNYFFAMKKNQTTLTFATFDPKTLAIPSSKAYLEVPKSSFSGSGEARVLSFFFNDEEEVATGISNSELGIMNSDQVIFDLQGRRVAQPTKGLYIVNGKKVVIK